MKTVRESLLPWKSNKYHIFVGARARPCVCPSAWACASVCVHVALLTQHATRMRHIVTSSGGPSGSTIFFDIIS